MGLSRAEVQISSTALTRADHLQQLRNLCQSDLERQWLDFMEQHHYNLPSHAQKLIENCHTRPDFWFENNHAAVYIDGFHHLFPDRQARDLAQQECMENAGYTVIRFGLQEEWHSVIARFASIFGMSRKEQ